jgi:hypothetical protein
MNTKLIMAWAIAAILALGVVAFATHGVYAFSGSLGARISQSISQVNECSGQIVVCSNTATNNAN